MTSGTNPTRREWHPGCTCPWVWRKDMGRLYGISMGGGWLRQSDAPDCPEHAAGKSHGGFEND